MFSDSYFLDETFLSLKEKVPHAKHVSEYVFTNCI